MADISSTAPLTRASVQAAHTIVAQHIHRTPVVASQTLSQIASTPQASLEGTRFESRTPANPKLRLWFKCENQQRIGAFKARGAFHAVAKLMQEPGWVEGGGKERGVVTHSSGNHAQALALAAKENGIVAHIIMPRISVPQKIAATKGYGANVVFSGSTSTEREAVADQVIADTGARLVPPYDHPDIMLGQGTMGLELQDQAAEMMASAASPYKSSTPAGKKPSLDAIITPCGGGGMLSGVALSCEGTGIRVFGSEPSFQGADDAKRGFESGERVASVSSLTVADGLRTPLGAFPWEVIYKRRLVTAMYSVTEDEIVAAMRLVFERMKMVVEPSACVPLAVALFDEDFRAMVEKEAGEDGWDLGIVFSGGNVGADALGNIFGTASGADMKRLKTTVMISNLTDSYTVMQKSKRKRVRKACIPCHQRKRKCDSEYPCGMCITYEYDCRYVAEDADKATTENVGDDNDSRPPKRASYEGTNIRESRASSAAGTDFRGPAAAPQESPVETGERYPRAKSPPGIFDEYKSRYAGASAAMAFPHVLGAALGSSTAPKMSPFAYNFGLRPEEASHLPHGGSLAQLIGEDDLAVYSAIYFHSLAPIGDLLDSKTYAKRCHDYYHDVGGGVNRLTFGAIAAGVAALGSFLSRNRHPREADLVRYTKTILDDPMSMRMLCIDHVVAWGMRVLYLRATSRPNNAWIASCTLMHLVEAIGLHKEENIAKMASLPMSNALGYDADRMRRIFWIGWAGHAMISYEYDRTSVSFRDVTCRAINPKPGSFADQFVQIVQIIPAPNSSTEELCECITKLDGLAALHPFLVVTKADLAFCFYRRIYQLKMGMPNDIIQLVIDSGNAAVKAAEQLASQGRMFWNVIGSVFQYTCVLLAIDTPASSVHVAAAFASLEGLVKAADTQPTREALSMARHLLRLGTERKRRELALLEAVEMAYDLPPQPQVGLSAVLPDVALQMDWDQFLVEPYLTMLGLDAPM